jgi:hypothetical protein
MVNTPELETLLTQNPRAREQAKVVGDALDLLHALRAQGMVKPHRYDLERPFAQRRWIGHRLGSTRKLSASAARSS